MKTCSYTRTTVPGNSEYLLVWDSTYGLDLPAAAAAEQAPGPRRGLWSKLRRLQLTLKNGNQAVTVVFRAMTNPAGTTAATAFETDTATGPGSGSVTLDADTTQTYNWMFPTIDSRVYVLAGADNPNSFVSIVKAFEDAEPGQ